MGVFGLPEAIAHLLEDRLDNTFRVLKDILIPEPEHLVAIRFDCFGTRIISKRILIKSAPSTVHLDDELGLVTGEIRDVPAQRHLATKGCLESQGL